MATWCATIFLLLVATSLCFAEEINVKNNCGRNLFVKNENVNSGSFMLGNGQSRKLSVNRGPRARVWAHSGCNNGGSDCDTTEGYVSLAEMHWDAQGKVWWDVSQVDGYNLPIRMDPYNAGAGGNCFSASCNFNMNANCPGPSKISKNGKVVGCKNLNRDAVTDYSKAIKKSCPRVYSWSKDDQAGMRDCNPGHGGLTITFC